MFAYRGFVAGVIGACLCGGLMSGAVSAAESVVPVQQIAGEIVWLDTQLGKLQLYADQSRGGRATAEYRIVEHETQVTDSRDKQFLAITDLRAGQHITIESVEEPTGSPWPAMMEGCV